MLLNINRSKYQVAQDRIGCGRWTVDAERGLIVGTTGAAIGYVVPNTGYVMVAISDGSRTLRCYAHRVIWESVHGPVAEDLEINHLNGDKADNRIANLEPATPSENLKHAFDTGLAHGRKGTAHHAARLDEASVSALRAEVAAGAVVKVAAQKFGISRSQAYRIVNRESWGHVAA